VLNGKARRTEYMNDETKISSASGTSRLSDSQKLRWASILLTVALSLLLVEAWYYFILSPLDAGQKALQTWTGVRAPDFSVTNLDGRAIRLGDLKGKRVMLNFWATWCPPCLEELPDFIKLRTEISSNSLAIIGLSTDDAVTQKTFARRNGLNYPLTLLQNVPPPYEDIVKIPVTFVIDRQGVIQHVLFGPQELKTLQEYASEPDFAGPVKSAPEAPGR
jgi:peroxiredoxin